VAIAGIYAYVAAGGSGLRIVNVSTPTTPSEVGALDTPGNAQDVAVAGSYAYVADGNSLRILNVSNPVAPFEVGFHDMPGNAVGVAVAGNYAYVANEGYWNCADCGGLRILDVSKPYAPASVDSYITPDALGVTAVGNTIYLADYEWGLLIFTLNTSPTAKDDRYGMKEDTPLTVAAPGVLGNDTDPDANPLTAVLDGGPTHGTLNLNGDGSFGYTPNPHYSGSDSFTYHARDSYDNSNVATVNLSVVAPIRLPIVMRNYLHYFEGPWEVEPNNTYEQANGPLQSGVDYSGYPNDANDYFFVELTTGGTLSIDLSNHTGKGVQMVLYDETAKSLARDYDPPYQIVYTGQAGRYYIQIYTESGYNANASYTLRVSYP